MLGQRKEELGLGLTTSRMPLLSTAQTLHKKELNAAYKRAGSAFKGQMQQNFVVLSEHGFGEAMDEARAGPTGANETVRGKRPREVGRLDSQIGTPKKQAKKQN